MRSGQPKVMQTIDIDSPEPSRSSSFSSVSSLSSLSSVSPPSEPSQTSTPVEPEGPKAFGRYILHAPIARGGMATIYIARLVGAEGFSRIVAAKRLYPQFTEDPEFVAMFHDEARIASKIHHPNVVPVLDVVHADSEVVLVQEYVHGVPLDKLFKASLTIPDRPIPVGIAVAIVSGVLAGLHAAHETRDEMDEPLHIVHRDVSPQNIMVSVEGTPRLLDFGIAKARSSAHVTRDGFFKGKVAYMSPEQLRAEDVTRTADVYACGVLLWELLVHRRLHSGRGEAQLFSAVLTGAIPTITTAIEDAPGTLSEARWQQMIDLEPIVSQALANNPSDRFATAALMLDALSRVCPAATAREVAEWVRTYGAAYLERRQEILTSHAESWRSQSRISAAPPSVGVIPESGVNLRRNAAIYEPSESSVVELSRHDFVDERALFQTRLTEAAKTRAIVATPWLVAAGLLVMIGILLGVLSSRPTPDADAIAARAAAASTAGTSAEFKMAPLKTPEAPALYPAPAALSTTATTATADTGSSARTASQQRWSPPPRPPASPPRAVVAPPAQPEKATSAAVPAPPAPSASSKPDCNPPFYFDGTKKLYKAGCL
ncbi:MAG: serine/threonine protein kinase [Myxococcaceae bacterium]|nr:serine/threonine protein kinase [Myxococcaceae bacterium]